jgi:2-hydroxychromene-2-carboxylate isomerase
LSQNSITYYMALNSPWTFLGGARLHDIASRHGVRVDVRPVDASKLFPVSGGLPVPKRAPQRQAYRMRELDRWRKHLDIGLILEPQFFPTAEAVPAAMVVAAEQADEDALALATGFGHALWVDDLNFAEPDVQRLVAERVGLDADKLMAAAGAPEIATVLDGYTQSAIDAQVFGMPSYLYDGDLLWGQDRLDFLERALAAQSD